MSDTCKTQDCDSPVAPEHDMCLMCGQREQIRVLADRVKELEQENMMLRGANCDNCSWRDGDLTCSNPIDQCGEGDRMMWQKLEDNPNSGVDKAGRG